MLPNVIFHVKIWQTAITCATFSRMCFRSEQMTVSQNWYCPIVGTSTLFWLLLFGNKILFGTYHNLLWKDFSCDQFYQIFDKGRLTFKTSMGRYAISLKHHEMRKHDNAMLGHPDMFWFDTGEWLMGTLEAVELGHASEVTRLGHPDICYHEITNPNINLVHFSLQQKKT